MRNWQRLSIAGVLICLLGLYPLLAPPAHRIDKDHFELIQNGMTLAEVESIFGQPAGNYDWAVADQSQVWFFDFAVAQKPWVGGGNNLQSGAVVVNEVTFDLTGQQAWVAGAAKLSKPRILIWTELVGHVQSTHSKNWTSRHGACTIGFDRNGRVGYKTHWGDSRVVPPWLAWWKKLFGD